MISLPFEVWLKIASFLPRDDRQKLYTVNHSLFQIAMDERYRVQYFYFRNQILANLKYLT